MPFDQATPDGTVDLLVPSMSCAGCMAKIERALASIPGVVSARANLTAHTVSARIEPKTTDAEALVGVLAEHGYAARPFDRSLHGASQTDRAGRDLLLRLGVAGFAAMNVMLLSISVWSGAEGTMRDLLHWVSALVALPAIAFSGKPFFVSAFSALKARRLNMDVPITLAIVLASANSVAQTARGGEHAYFDAGIMLIFFLLIGRYLEHRTRAGARSAAAELMAMTGRSALRVLSDGSRVTCPIDDLIPGMVLEIAPGERIPADGTISRGVTDLDRALVTGESEAVPASEGMEVHAGMLNLTGAIEVAVKATGDATLLAEIARMVDAAERGRGRYEKLADRAARIYAPGVHLLSGVAFLGWWWLGGDWHHALQIAVAVLIITCPCALALAVPTVHTVASSRLFRHGIFLKDGAELERLAEVDLIAFDKTGTLSDGAPHLISGPNAGSAAWPVAAALAMASRHPLSRALVKAAKGLGVTPAPVSEIREVPGLGSEGRLDGGICRLGRPGWAGDGEGTVSILLPDGEVTGFAFAESPRPDAVETCKRLTADGFDLAILSGDSSEAVNRMGVLTEISERHAELMPGGKLDLLAEWDRQGRKVLMVGDGLNDSPALAAAHASISPASAADVAKTAAGLIFIGDRLGAVAEAISVARLARCRALQSFGIAALYNMVAIPLAMAGFVTPLIAAAAMSGSSILVVLNALRMRK